jgi:LacI family transcriptional regulator
VATIGKGGAMTQTAGRTRSSARVTILDVARHAGVSATTVSHVLSGKRLVAAVTRERVESAVRDLGYRPNHVARNLRTRRSHMIALVVPDITNPFYSVLTRGLADAVHRGDYGTYICNTDSQVDRERTFLDDVMDRGVDGVVIASVNPVAEEAAMPVRFGTPTVCLGESIDDPHVDRVQADDDEGSHAATRHLLTRGAQRVAMIQGPLRTGVARIAGYAGALAEAGMAYDERYTARGDWTRRSGHRAMTHLMQVTPRPDAVFCANDLMAIGALDAARELGLSVPADVALAGFDDIDAAALVSPSLTTVGNPAYETGRSAGELLLSRLTGDYTGTRRTVVVPCPLILRESS